MNIELKDDNKLICDATMKVIHDYIDQGRLNAKDIIFCSFHHQLLADLKSQNPDFQIAPCIRTATLFGKENVIIPGWHVKEGASYAPEGIAYLQDFHRKNRCVAMDPVLWDTYKPMVDFAASEGLALHVSTSDVRTFERWHLLTVLKIAEHVPVFFKTDEPAMARRELLKLSQTVKAVLDKPFACLDVETVREPQPPSAPPEWPQVLERPVYSRPIPYSARPQPGKLGF